MTLAEQMTQLAVQAKAAAERLKMIQDGIVKVKIEVLDADRLR